MKKRCWRCKKLLNKDKFYPSCLKHWDYICIDCHHKKGKLYRLVNKEKIVEQKREYAKNNRDKINEYSKKWIRENRDKRKIICHRWYIKKRNENPGWFSIARAKYSDYKIVYNRNYRRQYPEKAASWKHKRRALEAKLGGYFTAEQWKRLKKEFNNTCPKCQKKELEIKLTVDHIIPINKWSTWIKNHNINYKWNNIENIQPLCKNCNSKKWCNIEDGLDYLKTLAEVKNLKFP